MARLRSFGRIRIAAGVDDFHRSKSRTFAIGNKPRHAGVRHQRNVRHVHDLADAVDVRIRLSMDKTRIAIACIAADAL